MLPHNKVDTLELTSDINSLPSLGFDIQDCNLCYSQYSHNRGCTLELTSYKKAISTQ
jgi:hypothetical protein